ncbi:MAG: hypothetical protein WB711_16580 [Terriglobales bacterium]
MKDTKVGITKREPEVYDQDELDQFFKVCTPSVAHAMDVTKPVGD